jgi:peptidoglycan/xylan/chitin deacetylase (PgdA/CDA1 family)
MKHALKGWLREAWSRALYHLGLWRLVDRLMPRRMLVLAGHCVSEDAVNGGLPADMKIEGARLERILGLLGQRFELVTVGDGLGALREGRGRRSMVALSMDDGYADNHSALLPLLERVQGRATVFLESRVMTDRRVNWSHKWFWLLDRVGAKEASGLLVAELGDLDLGLRLGELLEAAPEDLAYQAKRVLKYEARPEERDPALDAIFAAQGGDEAALVERIYMKPDDARALQASGRVELGGHTVHHHVLSTLSAEEQRAEVEGGRTALEECFGPEVGVTFAYPFGRRWDIDAGAVEAVRGAGFHGAVTTHTGVVGRETDPMRLPRWMIDDATPVHHLVCEACGGFELLRRVGLNLSE